MKNKIPVKILSHGIDPDGIISHSLLERFHLPNSFIKHYYLDYPDLFSKLEELSENRKSTSIVYVADLGLDQKIVDNQGILGKIKRRSSQFIWVDHHKGSFDNVDLIEQNCFPYFLEKEYCTSKIIQDLHINNSDDAYANFLANIAQAHDFEIQGDLYEKGVDLQDLISFRNRSENKIEQLDNLVKGLAINSAWDLDWNLNKRLQEEVSEFRIEKKTAYEDLENAITEHIIENKKVLCSYSNDILYMKTAPEHLRNNHTADLYVVIFDNEPGSVMIYGDKNKFDMKTIPSLCQYLGGGGRGHGGGFMFNETISSEDYNSKKEEVLEKIEMYFFNRQKKC